MFKKGKQIEVHAAKCDFYSELLAKQVRILDYF